MTYEEALEYIHARKRFLGAPTLERMRALTARLGNPQERLRVVHVAGTNGKGSTCAMIAGALSAAGYRTGLYTSPFVLDFRERIRVGGEMIPRAALAEEVERIKPLAEELGEVTEFELITAAAFDYFARENCGVIVAEVGLGGRFDATNVLERPLVSVITALGLDHTAVLGDTVERIAFEKSGIIKPGAPVVTCPGQDVDALAVILEEACKKGARVIQPCGRPEIRRMDMEGTDLCCDGLELHIPLAGAHQVQNALTAVAALREAGKAPGLEGVLAEGVIPRGIASVRMPARFEIIGRDPLVILDGAHNPHAARALARALEELAGDLPLTGVMGVLADKDGAGVLAALAPRLRRLICVTPGSPRALDAHELTQRADAMGLRASAAHTVEEAVGLARAVAASEGGAVVVCGSLYLAAGVRALFFPPEAE